VVFLSGSESVQDLCRLGIQISKREGWNPINQFNPVTFLCLSHTRTWISIVTCCGLFCVQWVKMRGECWFSWYWWNWWPDPYTRFADRSRTAMQ
jgi:hypothetical protein